MDETASRTVAIIPARGGSKQVPRKNLQRVGGVPLVERAVRAAVAAVGIDEVVVSTDDDEIAAVSIAAGARVIRRPAEISGDTATSESAILHALDELEAQGDWFDVVAFVQATSPFLPSDALAAAVDEVRADRADSVFSAYETYGFLWRRDEDAAALAINHDAAYRPRRQDREPHHLETGAFYVFRADGFRESKHRFFGRIRIAEVPEWTAIEIDDEQQLRIARALAALHEAPESIPVRAVVTDFDGVHTDDTRDRRCRRGRAGAREPRGRHGRRPAAPSRCADADPLHRGQSRRPRPGRQTPRAGAARHRRQGVGAARLGHRERGAAGRHRLPRQRHQ
nr:acylneuraminate cytidylyltransferase family protein [Microbacterium sp. W4I20]